jgi:hypothetical protein
MRFGAGVQLAVMWTEARSSGARVIGWPSMQRPPAVLEDMHVVESCPKQRRTMPDCVISLQ